MTDEQIARAEELLGSSHHYSHEARDLTRALLAEVRERRLASPPREALREAARALVHAAEQVVLMSSTPRERHGMLGRRVVREVESLTVEDLANALPALRAALASPPAPTDPLENEEADRQIDALFARQPKRKPTRLVLAERGLRERVEKIANDLDRLGEDDVRARGVVQDLRDALTVSRIRALAAAPAPGTTETEP